MTAALVFGAVVWQVTALYTSPAFLSSFTATVARIVEYTRNGVLVDALASSLLLFVTGFGFAVVAGVLAGLLLARSRLLRVALESYIMALYATPMVALIPFILSIMGFGFAPKALVVFLFAFFPILYNTVEGARSLKPELIEVAQSFRSSELAIWRDLLIPYTLPYALTGIRQARRPRTGWHGRSRTVPVGKRHGRAHHAFKPGLRYRRAFMPRSSSLLFLALC